MTLGGDAVFEYEARFSLKWSDVPSWKNVSDKLWIERGSKRQKFDEFIIKRPRGKSGTLTFSFSRAKKVEPQEVLSNVLRQRQLENIFLFVGLISKGRAPRLTNGELAPKGTSSAKSPSAEPPTAVPISDELNEVFDKWSYVSCAGLERLQSIGEAFFLTGERGRCLRVAASHVVWSHGRWEDEHGRLRDLWSGFNTLYQYIARQEKAGTSDCAALQKFSELITESDSTLLSEETVRYFRNEVVPVLDLLSWSFVARNALSTSRGTAKDCKTIKEITNICVLCRADSEITAMLERIESEVSEIEKKISGLPKNTPESDACKKKKADKYKEYRDIVIDYYSKLSSSIAESGTVDADIEPCLIAFICTQYLYQQRCSSMHGQSSHKPFYIIDPRRDVAHRLNDLLESCIADAMIYIANHYN